MSDGKNIMLVIEFDGTNYSGWQSQQNARSICDVVTNAITDLTNEDIILTGCGRTDAGVHALNYVCNFKTNSSIPPEKFCLALNTKLPFDISCKKSIEVLGSFHARYSAVSKRYIYVIQNTEFRPAINRKHTCHFPKPLDVELMEKAISYIVGRHDFKSFMASGSKIKDTVRTIFELNIQRDDDVIQIEICGDGFLYNMVRIIAGTLIDVGEGKVMPDDLKKIIESKNRKKAGKTAPASGLYFVEVQY